MPLTSYWINIIVYLYLSTSEAKTIMITLSNSKNKHHIIVCCSGGADSMALLMMCYQYVNWLTTPQSSSLPSHNIGIKDNHLLNSELPNQQHSITMSAFHVKHGLSPNQHDWANLVKSKCDSLNIPLHVVEINPHQRPLSETEARKLRYEALDEYIDNQVLDVEDADTVDVIVVTGHHKNDRLENYLISIFKNRTHNFDLINHVKSGTGNSVVSYQKPLLNMTKNELIDYCHQHQLNFVHDESNDVSDNLRNIIRNQLFKYMDKLKHKAQYMISLERFFDNYKTFNEFYIASVRQFISTMKVKVILDGNSHTAKHVNNANTTYYQQLNDENLKNHFSINLLDSNIHDFSNIGLLCRSGITLRYSCSMEELKKASHGKYIEFVAHMVQMLYNHYYLHLSSNNTSNYSEMNKNLLKCSNHFNFSHFIQSFPNFESNNKQYKVDDFLFVWIKDGMLFIKIKSI